MTQDIQSSKNPLRRPMRSGTGVVWPKGVEERYGITYITRWRWERAGLSPPRDVHIGGHSGWRPETLAAAESRIA